MTDLYRQLQDIKRLPVQQQLEILEQLAELERAQELDAARNHFMPFVKRIWPEFIEGAHHHKMADAFERVARGEARRIIINMPPRHTKSEFASFALPAWWLGQFPTQQVIQSSHTADLAQGFGRKVRNLIASPEYHEVFPDIDIAADSKSAGRWNTNKGGRYYAMGVGGALAGRGANLFIIDDPHSEQDYIDAQNNPDIWRKVYEWYASGPRQRLQPGGAIIIVMTRWSLLDLTGQVLKRHLDVGGEEWELIELPAILQANDREKWPQGKPLWPEYWNIRQLLDTKAELPVGMWNAQYMQSPTSEEGALIKREKWQKWENRRLPPCQAIITAWDTAFHKTDRSDYSACTTWGIFDHDGPDGKKRANLILLDAFKDKYSFPELKAMARAHYNEWKPDMILVETRASGEPLMYELRAMGIPVTEFKPVRGNDKFVRVNSVTDIFNSGLVWVPPTKWGEEVIEECAAFPNGAHDDYVDTVTMALLRFRQGGWLRADLDEEWDEPKGIRRKADYY